MYQDRIEMTNSQPLVNLTRSHHKQLLVQWTRSSYSKIYRITFSPMDQKWSYFLLVFIEIVTEIEVIAQPALAEAFQMK